jgi:hypothetical protein
VKTVWASDPAIRLRPVPEMECCLAYLPRRVSPPRPPALHGLNLTSWLVLTLCDGRDDLELAREYADAMAETSGPGRAAGALNEALSQLQGLGLIRRTAQEKPS